MLSPTPQSPSAPAHSLSPACGQESGAHAILTLLWVLASIFKEPVVILSFVLVSKGWCIISEEMERCDVWRIVVCSLPT